jgi:hypothetical protein
LKTDHRKKLSRDTGEYFTAPEQRLYGDESNTFRESVREWAWERQQDQFIEVVDGKKTLSLPDFDNLQRMGGSYEDTKDGETLNRFFSQSGKTIKVYNNVANVEHILDPYEEEIVGINVDAYQVQIDEMVDQYNNQMKLMALLAIRLSSMLAGMIHRLMKKMVLLFTITMKAKKLEFRKKTKVAILMLLMPRSLFRI